MPPPYDLFLNPSGLPKTLRSKIPYEIDALAPRESWGAGNGSTSILCRQKWDTSTRWIADMVGEVGVIKPGSAPLLKRYIPEYVQFDDDRPHFCSITDQVDQGGINDDDTFIGPNGWPQTQWCRYRAVFEVFPYALLNDTEVAEAQAAAGAYPGPVELYRYVVRSRRTYSREQPIPGASKAGGFKVIDPDPEKQRPIGQVGFRVVSMADVTYKWVRVPINWPPPIGYAGGVNPSASWCLRWR